MSPAAEGGSVADDLLDGLAGKMARYCAGERGLEIGCGQQKLCPRATGVDNNPLVHPDLICDAIRLPFPEGSMDFVVAIRSLEYFWYTLEALWEWSRVLRPGGACGW